MRSILAVCISVATFASAAEPTELVEQLRAELKSTATAFESDQSKAESLRKIQTLLPRIRLEPADLNNLGNHGAGDTVMQSLATMESMELPEKVEKLASELQREIRDRRQAEKSAMLKEIEELLRRTLRGTVSSTDPKQLDVFLAEISGMKDRIQRRRPDSDFNPFHTSSREATEFIRSWQDLLVGVKNSRGSSKGAILRTLTSSSSDLAQYVPRSEALAKVKEFAEEAVDDETYDPEGASKRAAARLVDQQKRIDEIIGLIDELGDLPGAATKIKAIRSESVGRNLGGSYESPEAERVKTMARQYEQLTIPGAPVFKVVPFYASSFQSERLRALYYELALLALPRVLLLPEEVKAKEGENVAGFLHRLSRQARDGKDWPLLQRIVVAAQDLNLENVANSADYTAFAQFRAGLNQQKAGENTLAAHSFQTALRTGSTLIPAELVGEYLAQIKKEDPASYEAGMKLVLNPPASQHDPSGRRPPGMSSVPPGGAKPPFPITQPPGAVFPSSNTRANPAQTHPSGAPLPAPVPPRPASAPLPPSPDSKPAPPTATAPIPAAAEKPK